MIIKFRALFGAHSAPQSVSYKALFGAHSAQQSVSYKARQQSHHLITISLNIIKLIIITILMVELGVIPGEGLLSPLLGPSHLNSRNIQ